MDLYQARENTSLTLIKGYKIIQFPEFGITSIYILYFINFDRKRKQLYGSIG